MAQKNTTSDQLKKAFEQLGGNAKDWKRVQKSKNEAGQVVRVFENAAIGKKIEATELGKKDAQGNEMFSIRTLSGGGAVQQLAVAEAPHFPTFEFTIEVDESYDGSWRVNCHTWNSIYKEPSDDDVDENSLPDNAMENMLKAKFGADYNRKDWDFGADEGTHRCRKEFEDEEAAQRYGRQVAYALMEAGMKIDAAHSHGFDVHTLDRPKKPVTPAEVKAQQPPEPPAEDSPKLMRPLTLVRPKTSV